MKNSGFTLIELVVTVAIVSILATVALPMLQLSVQRVKENELRTNLRQIREAIDAYKKVADMDNGPIKKTLSQSGYPPSLEVLVYGVVDEKDPNKHKIRFLRNIPLDPMQPANQASSQSDRDLLSNWGLRSYKSEANNPAEGDDVYDVYSRSRQIGINGVPYNQW
ncbi:type II secretion system protein [Methylotenera sp.]|uniref:type II secretion system protein n=1 Tax=Methylotenera sp. TaxID=2051956 RepID=UPI0024887AD8|nr:type II secretion system protein [Methylotenera sp.]MDI1298994.1 type II secretion system protein [Methylotenera sp.]